MCQAISELTCRQFNKALRLSPLFAVLATDHVLTVGDCITNFTSSSTILVVSKQYPCRVGSNEKYQRQRRST